MKNGEFKIVCGGKMVARVVSRHYFRDGSSFESATVIFYEDSKLHDIWGRNSVAEHYSFAKREIIGRILKGRIKKEFRRLFGDTDTVISIEILK